MKSELLWWHAETRGADCDPVPEVVGVLRHRLGEERLGLLCVVIIRPRSFSHDISRVLVFAKRDELAVPQVILTGPFQELELSHELRSEPLAIGHLRLLIMDARDRWRSVEVIDG